MINLHTCDNKGSHHVLDNELCQDVWNLMSHWYMEGDNFNEYTIQISIHCETPEPCDGEDIVTDEEEWEWVIGDDTMHTSCDGVTPLDFAIEETVEQTVEEPVVTDTIDDIPILEVNWT